MRLEASFLGDYLVDFLCEGLVSDLLAVKELGALRGIIDDLGDLVERRWSEIAAGGDANDVYLGLVNRLLAGLCQGRTKKRILEADMVSRCRR